MDPKWVVSILNRYLSSMVTIVKKYGGTVDEFIGDAVFVLFGAPDWQDDDAQRAVACAVEMQLAMAASMSKIGTTVCPKWKWASDFIPDKSLSEISAPRNA